MKTVPQYRVTCPYCQKDAKLVDSIVIYKTRSYGMIWLCEPCGAYVGVHKNNVHHAPLGTLANAELRRARNQAHQAFDPLWMGNLMHRSQAYGWLAWVLGIPKRDAHIAMFDKDQCERVCHAVADLRRNPQIIYEQPWRKKGDVD